MAKQAKLHTTTTWILLREARALAIEAYDGATQLAERKLVEWLGQGRVRWGRCRLFEPARVGAELAERQRAAATRVWAFEADVAYSEGDPAFWRPGLKINWEQSWAREMYAHGGNEAYGVRVVREDVLAQLPEQPSDKKAAPLHASARWIAAEARQMKVTGEIPPTPTEFAAELAQRMAKAADVDRFIRPIKMESIRNKLHEWELWPPSLVK